MDETEITNNEYRQFTNWVRDSIVRTFLAKAEPEKFAKKYESGDMKGEPIMTGKQCRPIQN